MCVKPESVPSRTTPVRGNVIVRVRVCVCVFAILRYDCRCVFKSALPFASGAAQSVLVNAVLNPQSLNVEDPVPPPHL